MTCFSAATFASSMPHPPAVPAGTSAPAVPCRYEPREAWAVFSGEADLWWLRLLKPGFRHCFALARDERHWIVLDPLSPHLELAILPLPRDFDVPAWLEKQGMTVTAAPLHRDYRKPAPANWFSCVEVVKRFLGIHHRHIMTPWQLYRFLNKESCSA